MITKERFQQGMTWMTTWEHPKAGPLQSEI